MIEEDLPFEDEFLAFVFLDEFKVYLQYLLQTLILNNPTLSEAEEEGESIDLERSAHVSLFPARILTYLSFFVM